MYQELTKDTKSFAYARLFLSTNGAPLTNLLYSRNVSAITLAGTDPVAITTSVNHGFVTGDKVVFHNVGGTTELNLNAYTITKTGDATFTLDGTDSSTFSAWTVGGTCQNYTLRWFTGEGDFSDYLAPASASAQNRAGSSSCVITLEASLLDTEGIYCLELGHGLCYPAVVLVRVADAPTESLTAEDVWTYATRILTANTNLNDPSAATIAAAVQVLLDAAHGEDSWEALDIDTAKAAIAEAVRVLLEFYHGPGSWEGGAGALPDVGEVAVTYTVYDTNKTTPLSGVVVRVSTDALGVNIIRGKISDVFGQVRFNLDRGTYYIWRYRGDKEFSNPDIEVVE